MEPVFDIIDMMKNKLVKLIKILIISSTALLLISCSPGDFYLLGKKEITLEVHTPYIDDGYHIKDDLPVTVSAMPDTDILGTYPITYTATIAGKTRTLKRIVKVVDTQAPKITLTGSIENIKCPAKPYQEEGYRAFDNFDGDLTAKVSVSSVKDGYLYSVKDSSGNLAEIIRSFTLKDTVYPILTLNGAAKITLPLNGQYTEYGASATDNCDDVSQAIQISSDVNTALLGTYAVTYSVTDKSGNTTVQSREVIVADIPQTIVYLTFDDGPSLLTPDILAILKAYGVKATFFVGKKSDDLKYLLTMEHDQGNTVALHAYIHNYYVIYQSTEIFFTNLYKVQDWVQSATGVKSYLYRFPGGSSNTASNYNPGIMTTLARMIQEAGFHYFDWSVSSGDGNSKTTSAQMIKNVTSNIKPGKSYVVLMHDSAGHNATVAALPVILNYLQSIGAQMLPITMDTPQVHHRIAN